VGGRIEYTVLTIHPLHHDKNTTEPTHLSSTRCRVAHPIVPTSPTTLLSTTHIPPLRVGRYLICLEATVTPDHAVIVAICALSRPKVHLEMGGDIMWTNTPEGIGWIWMGIKP
jgi:hypothetical protein